MEAGLTDSLTSEHLKNQELFEVLAPYYLSIGMTLDEYWNGRPELVLTYFRAECIRIRRVQREAWMSGIYTMRGVSALFSKQSEYPREPIPVLLEDVERQKKETRAADLARFKAGVRAWAEKSADKKTEEVTTHEYGN